ncbi:MAG: hypothetical protein QM736_15880 [Vicinamibacterales bacterium]
MARTHTYTTMKMTRRLRRLRTSEPMRALVRETRLSPDNFVLPLFVCEGEGIRREVSSMPGVFNLSVDEAVKETAAASAEGVKGVLLFGLPDHKDDIGSSAYNPDAPVQACDPRDQTRGSGGAGDHRRVPLRITPITDTADCSSTTRSRTIRRSISWFVPRSLTPLPARTSSLPSDMMDGRVRAIREALDDAGFDGTSQSCRTRRSSPAGSMVRFAMRRDLRRSSAIARATRWTRAMSEEALREVELDIEEGADIVMVKPAVPYLDVLSRVKEAFRLSRPPHIT